MLIGLSCGLTGPQAAAPGAAFAGPPPGVAGALPDLTLDGGTGIRTVDAAAVFDGPELAFALATPVAGVTVDRATGLVSIDTGATGVLDGQPVRVRATNGAGAAAAEFALTVGSGVGGDYVIVFDGLVDGALGVTARVGSTVTVAVPGFTGPLGVQWLSDGAAIAGATAPALTVPAAADGTELSAETEPLGLPRRTGVAGTVRHAPPTVTGALPDLVAQASTGPLTVDAGAVFAVANDPDLDGATFALDDAPAGVAIDAATGVITIDTDTMPPQDGSAVAVRATTSGGSAATGFALSLTDGPLILVSDFEDATDSGGFETSAPADGTLEAAFVAAGAPAPVPAAQGGWTGATLAAVSVPAPDGGAAVTLPYGALDGPADLWLYQRTGAGARSNLVRVGFAADGRAPALSLVSPVPGASGIAADAPLILGAGEPVTAGTGSVRILSGGVPVETVAAAALTVDGDTVTVPHAPFPPSAAIEVEWDAGLVLDLARNPAPAGTGGTAAGFEAEAEPFAAALTGPLRQQDTGATGRLNSFAFAGVPLGQPSPGREIFLLIGTFTNEGPSTVITGVTVDGVAATEVAQVQNEVGASVWRIPRPTGTAADVTVAVNGQGAFCMGLAAVRATGHRLLSSDIGQGTTATGRVDLDTAPGGHAFAVFMIVNGAEPGITGGMAKTLAADIRSNEWLTLAGGPTAGGTQVGTVATYPAALRNVAAGLSLEAI